MKKILIIGLGSIGQRYASLLHQHGGLEIFALRQQGNDVVEGVKNLYSWDEVASAKPDIAFITNPTSLHIATAIQCARLGMHLFIEKPLDKNLLAFDELHAIVKEQQLQCYVAYNLRFHPGILDLKEVLSQESYYYAHILNSSYLPAWRPGADYWKNYSGQALFGGGVLLDLSHELDYAQFLFGEIQHIEGYFEHSSDLKIDVEDTADLSVFFINQRRIQIHLDFCSLPVERVIKVFGQKSVYIVDLIKNTFQTYSYDGSIKEVNYEIDRNAMYARQIDYFLIGLRNETSVDNLEESAKLLKCIIEFKAGKK
ncbi:MAG: Gfo/Idh/MocA family oxidoreductase [Candidatus Omnitrophica bacterium]|nr:Gfo/Idh/MocA family oxidoreductase [Candidatus Omnitrophota bacterium]